MQLTVEQRQEVEVASFTGRIDGDAAPTLRNAAGLSRTLPVVFDLSGVEFLDSAGLGAFVLLIRSCRDARVPCVISSPTPLVAKILRVTAIHQLAPVAPGLDQALATLNLGERA